MYSGRDFTKKSKENKKKAIVRILEIDNDGQFDKEELGFGVRIKTDKNFHWFVTSHSVLKTPFIKPDESKIVAERYCAKYPNHRGEKSHGGEIRNVISSAKYRVSIGWFEGSDDREFLEFLDNREFMNFRGMHNKLYAYAFDKHVLVTLILDKCSDNNYKIQSVETGFQVKRAKGAPVIVCDPLNNKPFVVGFLEIDSDGKPYPVFLTEEKMNEILTDIASLMADAKRINDPTPPNKSDEERGDESVSDGMAQSNTKKQSNDIASLMAATRINDPTPPNKSDEERGDESVSDGMDQSNTKKQSNTNTDGVQQESTTTFNVTASGNAKVAAGINPTININY